MFNLSNEILLIALIGLGLYAQSNELNLANNTSILLILFLLFMEGEEHEKTKRELCCVEALTGTERCNCAARQRGRLF